MVTLLTNFKIENSTYQIIPFGNGHINETFRVINQKSTGEDYLLQRINHQIFNDVAALMSNIRQVTKHINAKEKGATLELIQTKDNANFHKDTKGRYWRMYRFRKELHTLDIATTPDQIYEGAKTYGKFLYQLSDFPAQQLTVILPDFHNVMTRLIALQAAIQKDTERRVRIAKQEIDLAKSMVEELIIIQRLANNQHLPIRVTHNDTKFNNVLLSAEGKGKCVVDLETVMPGLVHFDFGDGVRTTVTTMAEDEADLSKIEIDLERYKAFHAGYLECTNAILTPLEYQYLPLSGALLAYLMGIRFLTDYLSGDVYYKTHFEAQNKQRALAQLTLAKRLLERQIDFTLMV